MKKRGKVFSALAAGALALLLSPTLAHADSLSVTLETDMTLKDSKQQPVSSSQFTSSVDGQVIEVDSDGTIQNLPTPSIAGWNFIGWYTEPTEYCYWDTDDVKYPKLPAGWEGTVDPADGKTYEPEGDYWTWLSRNSGTKIENGDSASKLGDKRTLYAWWDAANVHTEFWMNGWNNQTYRFLDAGGDYYRKFAIYHNSETNNAPTAWAGHKFTGWKDANGKLYNEFEWIQGDLKVFVSWEDDAGATNPGYEEPEWGDPKSIEIRPESVKIDPKAKTPTSVEAWVATDSNFRANPANITFEVDRPDLVDIQKDNEWAKITPKGQTGTVELMAKVKTKTGRTLVDKSTIVLDHTYDQEPVVTKYPTCTEDGEGYAKCRTCGETHSLTWEKNGHRFTYHTVAPTCTKDGCEERVCVVCGKHESETTPALKATGHKYALRTVSTCTGSTQIKTCSACGNQVSTTSSTGAQHAWNNFKTIDKPATCSTEGTRSTHCANCSLTKDQEVIPATDTHAFGAWTTKKAATETETGLREHKCTVCGTVEDEVIAPLSAKPTLDNSNEADELVQVPSQPNGNTGSSGAGVPSGSGGSTGGNSSGTSGGSAGGSTGGQVPTQPSGDDGATTPDEPAEELPDPTPDADVPSSGDSSVHTAIYRLYNKWSSEHLYTTDPKERANCVKNGWTDETGTNPVVMPEKSATPVYRLYNQWTGEHHYSTSKTEVFGLVKAGWTDEGTAFYASDTVTSVPVYRLWRGDGAPGAHHYTTDFHEKSVLVSQGWHDEGICWYGLPQF